MRKVGVHEDDPAFRNPPEFPSSGSALASAAAPRSALGPSSEAPLTVVRADPPSASEVPPEVPPSVDAVPKACPVISEATSAGPKASMTEPETPLEIDCNANAAAL